jgi:peptide/nickel transport system substrate-binding protein
MTVHQRRLWASVAIALVASACTGGAPHPNRTTGSSLPFKRGGTLRVTLSGWVDHEQSYTIEDGKGHYALDPQGDWFNVTWELFRCCLLRTLMSYNGTPTREGGATPEPDLAAGMPDVSSDALTWTFHLKRGIHYAPPFQNQEVVAQDFIRALLRGASPSIGQDPMSPTGYHPINDRFDYLYWVIQGYRDMEDGKADAISGVEAPTPYTLVFHLTQPTGDLPYRLAMPQTAPIPPSPSDPSAPLGAATGHSDGYGRFLAASGPYMIEGSGSVDYSRPPAEQTPITGYAVGASLTLVRNPSWDPTTDHLRPAYPDRIELKLVEGGPPHDQETIDYRTGHLDIAYFIEGSNNQDLVPQYLSDPALRNRVVIYPADYVQWMSMNLAVPPFDDIHVRKAVNLIVDKQKLVALNGGTTEANPAGHLAYDSVEDNLLLGTDVYATTGDRGDLAAAEAEMRQSRYDHDHDGLCDDPACLHIAVLSGDHGNSYWLEFGAAVRASLKRIGLTLDIKLVDFDTYFQAIHDPTRHLPLVFLDQAFKDYPSGSAFFQAFTDRQGPDHSLISASPEELKSWGYKITEVPSVTDRFDRCEAEIGSDQTQCWAGLDEYLMLQVVPWVPLLFHNRQRMISSRVIHFSYDQFTTLPALDQIALSG